MILKGNPPDRVIKGVSRAPTHEGRTPDGTSGSGSRQHGPAEAELAPTVMKEAPGCLLRGRR